MLSSQFRLYRNNTLANIRRMAPGNVNRPYAIRYARHMHEAMVEALRKGI
jgi:hypothetical protein